VQPDGSLGQASDVKVQTGQVGPSKAPSAPEGSFAISGHDRTHGHMILSDPTGNFVLGADLGADQLLVWRYDAASGKLIANDPAGVSLPPGDGPRHFAFHPNGHWLYSLQEEGSTLVLFDYDGARLRRVQLHVRGDGFGRWPFRLRRQPAARHHRLVRGRGKG
jgi:6-phosphogluconolactonase (cycloisomerase 2 family)